VPAASHQYIISDCSGVVRFRAGNFLKQKSAAAHVDQIEIGFRGHSCGKILKSRGHPVAGHPRRADHPQRIINVNN